MSGPADLNGFNDINLLNKMPLTTLPCGNAAMDDIRNDVLFRFRDVTKQNGRTSVGTLYREPLGEILVHYKSGYKIGKGLR